MQRLKQFIKKATGKMVYVAGIESSGSTYVYQVVNALGIEALKGHERITRKGPKLVTYRDPRDIICSYAKRQLMKFSEEQSEGDLILKAYKVLFEEYKRQDTLYHYLKDDEALMIRYEDYFKGNEKALIQLIVSHFSLEVTDLEVEDLLERFSLEQNKKRAEKFSNFGEYDAKTQIHGNHISNNGELGVWRRVFTPEIVEVIKPGLNQLLIDFGYENDLNWNVST